MLGIVLKNVGYEKEKSDLVKIVQKAIGKDVIEKLGGNIRFYTEPVNTQRMLILIGERNDNDLTIEVSVKDIDQLN